MTSPSEILVHFIEVGSRRRSWDVRLSALTRSAMIAAIFRSGAVANRQIDVRFHPGSQLSGLVLAGPKLTPVGRFVVEAKRGAVIP